MISETKIKRKVIQKQSRNSTINSTLQEHARLQIEALIDELQLVPGSKLPSVREISKITGITRATTGNTITKMINAGLLVSQPQKGVYLNARPKEYNSKKLKLIYCLVEGGGHTDDHSLEHSPIGYLEHNPFWNSLMAGIRNVVNDMDGVRLRLSFLEDFLAEEDVTPRGRDWSEVGFIILGDPHKEYIPQLIRLNAPIVLANGATKSPHIGNVNIDCALGTEQIVEHLISLGHKNIAYCGTLQRKHQYNYRKFMGYKRTMQNYALPVRKEFCQSCYFSMQDGYDAAKHLLALPVRPTAILFMNDESAIGAIRAVVDAGLTVPGDISIAGFDNIVSGSFSNPSLTTVSSRMIEMGELSMKSLVKQFETKKNNSISLMPKLIVRESTGMVYGKN